MFTKNVSLVHPIEIEAIDIVITNHHSLKIRTLLAPVKRAMADLSRDFYKTAISKYNLRDATEHNWLMHEKILSEKLLEQRVSLNKCL